MKISIILMTVLAIMVAVCSYFQFTFVPYVVSLVVICVIGLVAFDKVSDRLYPVLIVGLALSMLWQQTMIGSYILGTDIHQEYFMANKALNTGWDLSYLSLNGTSVLLNIVSPLLAKIGIPIVLQFKLLFPMVLSIVPLILYYAFSKQISKKYAFYSVLFFMFVPVFTVEIATITKSMVAELFFALIVLALFSKWSNLKKGIIITVFGILACMCHYTIGTLVFGYLGLISIGLIVYKIISKKNNFVPVVISTIVIGLIGVVWFANAGGGIVYRGYTNSFSNISNMVQGETESSNDTKPYLEKQDSLVRTALGMDWNEVSISGKLFRVIQYITQLAIIVGAFYLIFTWRKKKYAIEFLVGLVASVVLLGLVLFVPKVASIINTTRWYHSALFFASPLFVMGLSMLRKEKVIAVVLVVYYVFTSGLVYTLTRSEVPELTLQTPYSVAYNYHQGLIGIFKKDDINCAKWLIENMKDKQVHTGFTDMYLFLGYVEYNGQFVEKAPKESHYLFLSSQNIKLNKMTTWTEPAMRKFVNLPDTSNMIEVYRSGESVVYYER